MTRSTERHAHTIVRATRRSQAIVITAVDRVSGLGSLGPPWLARATRLPLGAMRELLGSPVAAVDQWYPVSAQLLELHRNFSHRLLEALDVREDEDRDVRRITNVVPLIRRRG